MQCRRSRAGEPWGDSHARGICTHNLKVVGSNPTPATTEALENINVFKDFFIFGQAAVASWQTIGKQIDSHMSCHEAPHAVFVRSSGDGVAVG